MEECTIILAVGLNCGVGIEVGRGIGVGVGCGMQLQVIVVGITPPPPNTWPVKRKDVFMHGKLEIVTFTVGTSWARYPLLGLIEKLELEVDALQATVLTILYPYKYTTQVHV